MIGRDSTTRPRQLENLLAMADNERRDFASDERRDFASDEWE
jgi:hypothetical protein